MDEGLASQTLPGHPNLKVMESLGAAGQSGDAAAGLAGHEQCPPGPRPEGGARMKCRLSWAWLRARLPAICLVYLSLGLLLLKHYYREGAEVRWDSVVGVREVEWGEPGRAAKAAPKAPPHPDSWWDYDQLLPPDATPRNVTILMWTEYYHNKDLTEHVRKESPVPPWCRVTFDRAVRQDADALVFHVTGSDTKLDDLPPRLPRQPWVFYTIEPPSYMARQASVFNGLFNRTMTYRLDSDYPCPYGYFVRRSVPLAENPYWGSDFPRRSKTKLAAWMVSHCSTAGRREELARRLQRHVGVDVYGSCGTLSCDRADEEGCYAKLGRAYKFYLSFENSLCKDYVTEKFSNALRYNLVPVVYGGANYSAHLPHPKSFIDARDFASVKDLADYLKYLSANETAYAEYFEWRRFYKEEIRQGFAGFRRMCYALQPRPQPTKVLHDVARWWTKDGNCHSPTTVLQ